MRRQYKNGTHSQVALILHHLKYLINLWPLKCYSHIVKYFYLVGCVAYRQLLCVLYLIFMCILNSVYVYFMHINVSGRSVLLIPTVGFCACKTISEGKDWTLKMFITCSRKSSPTGRPVCTANAKYTAKQSAGCRSRVSMARFCATVYGYEFRICRYHQCIAVAETIN